MTTVKYRLVSELARAGDQFDVPTGITPVVKPSDKPGLVRVTYLKPVTSIPIEDDAQPGYVA